MIATRKASHEVIQWAAAEVPHLVGGSADLEPSTLTLIDDGGSVQTDDYTGRNVHFGVREHGMGAIVNGLCLHGLRAFGSTFFIFSDYMKGAIRLAALMQLPSIFVFTHDSIGLGEDGPTHQPIEQLAQLRATPNLYVVRPGRRERDGAGLALRDRADRDAAWRSSQPPGPAGLEPGRRAGRRDRARRLRAARVVQGARAGPDPDRDRLGGAPLHRGRRPARGRRDRHARRVDAVHGPLRRAGRRLPRQRAAAVGARARVGRGRRDASAGTAGSARTATRSGCAASARRRRSRSSTSTSASPRRTSSQTARRSSRRRERERDQQVTVNERLAALTAAGTSVWLDQIRRRLIESGELQRLIDEDSLRGVTSNPAIFEKAILGSTDYDDEIERAGRRGPRPEGDLRGDRDQGRPARGRRAAARLGRDRRRRRLRLARGRARRSRTTPRARSSRRATSGSASTAPT